MATTQGKRERKRAGWYKEARGEKEKKNDIMRRVHTGTRARANDRSPFVVALA